MNWYTKLLIGLGFTGLIFLIGFLVGRNTFEPKVVEKIEYLPGEPIRDSVPKPVPYEVIKPADTLGIIKQCIADGIYTELFPIQWRDSIVYITELDSTQFMIDWATLRKYNQTLFDNKDHGKLVVDVEVQYDRMKSLKYQFDPVTKVVTNTVYKYPTFEPFLGAGLGLRDFKEVSSINAQAGLFFKQHYGLFYQYQWMTIDKYSNHSIGILYKF